jgi:RNA polymerase sigma-70 factor (ECF subfamily)
MADDTDQESADQRIHWLPMERTFMTLNQRVGALYEELRLDVYRYVLTLGLPPHMAQDVTQDSFIRLYEALHQAASVENVRAWLLRVAHNLAVNAVTSKDFRALELDAADSITTLTAEDRVIEQERRNRFRAEILRLSKQQKGCLELRAQGLRYREIGEIMGISTSAVGEFLRRAISRLREALDD